MSFLESVFLGIIQGITEFLPVSSSGHLAIAKHFFSLSQVPLLYDILLHLATLLAVCLVYRKTIWRLICVACRFVVRKTTEADRGDLFFILAILVATLCTGILGVLLKDVVKQIPVYIIPIFFIITGIVLLLSDKIVENKHTDTHIHIRSAIIVGIVQGLAVFPGISRSGSTISAGLFSNIKRSSILEFSFILSIPAILGALVLELVDMNATDFTMLVPLPHLIVGFIVSFCTGLFALKIVAKLFQKARLRLFSFYLIPLGLILSVYFIWIA